MWGLHAPWSGPGPGDIGESKLSMHGLCMGNAFHFMRNEVNGFLSTHELMHQLVKKQVLTHLLLNFFSL